MVNYFLNLKLFAMKTMTRITIGITLLIFHLYSNSFAQNPVINWMYDYAPNSTPFPATAAYAGMGEDWYYSITPVKNSGGDVIAYMAVGYGSHVNNVFYDPDFSPPTSCDEYLLSDLESYSPPIVKGEKYHKIVLLDLTGKVIWRKERYGHFGFLVNVHQLSDGNFVATGFTFYPNISLLNYNPTASDPDGYEERSVFSSSKKKMYVMKFDGDGNVLWEFMYGLEDNTEIAYKYAGFAYDVVEGSNPNELFVTGFNMSSTVNIDAPSDTLASRRLVLFKLKSSDGTILGKWYYDRDIYHWTRGCAIERIGSNLYIGGEIVVYPTERDTIKNYPGGDVLLIKVPEASPGSIQTAASSIVEDVIDWANDEYADRVHDLSVSSDSKLLVGAIVHSNKYNPLTTKFEPFGQTYGDGGNGIGKVLKYEPDLSSYTSYDLGAARAYDLKVGVAGTADGGFVAITSEPTNYYATHSSPTYLDCDNDVQTFDTYVWESNAKVVKFNASGTEEWRRVFDDFTPRGTAWPQNVKKQECLYQIIEPKPGTYIGCGNNSMDFDCDYAFQLSVPCLPTSAVEYNAETPISGTVTWNTNRSIKGTVRIPSGATLKIQDCTVQFADTKQYNDIRNIQNPTTIIVEAGGKLYLQNAVLKGSTECGTMWDGIQLKGNPNATQSSSTQPLLTASYATVQDARVAALCGKFDYTFGDEHDLSLYTINTGFGGGIVAASNCTFNDNYISYCATPYAVANSNSHFDFCDFENNNAMKDLTLSSSHRNPNQGHYAHALLVATRNVNFRACNFNGNAAFDEGKRGNGIISVASAFTVKDLLTGYVPFYSTSVGVGSEFNNLNKGIDAYSFGSVYQKALVKNNQFNNVEQGITLNGLNFSTIYNNEFNYTTAFAETPNDKWAVYTYGGLGYDINQNVVNGLDYNQYGIIARNGYTFDGRIRHNELLSTQYAIQTEQDNRDLRTECNFMYDFTTAMSVNPSSPTGALRDQGDGCDEFLYRPKNRFDPSVCSHLASTIAFDYFENINNPDPLLSSCMFGSAAKTDCVQPTEDCVAAIESTEPNYVRVLTPVGPPPINGGMGWPGSSGDMEALSNDARYYLQEDREDSLIKLLELSNYAVSNQILAFTYLQAGDTAAAHAKINSLPQQTLDEQLCHGLLTTLLASNDIFALSNTSLMALDSITHYDSLPTACLTEALLQANYQRDLGRTPEKWTSARMVRQTERIDEEQDSKKVQEIFFNIYPNPTSDVLMVQFELGYSTNGVSFYIFDLSGKMVNSIRKERVDNKSVMMFDVSGLSNGSYIVKLINAEGVTYFDKFVISK